jgi:hypothetical protein
MFRLACCLGVEAGVKICAPIHDAVLLESPLNGISRDAAVMREAMAEASRAALGGFEIRTEVKIITDRFSDPRGRSTWDLVRELLDRCPASSTQFGLFETLETENSGVPSPIGLH